MVLSSAYFCEQAGVDILTISELMGHRTIQMTKRYAHLARAHNQDAVDRLVAYQAQQTSREPKNAATEASATISATSSESTEATELVVVH